MTMIERVARAIHNAEDGSDWHPIRGCPYCISLAKTAIEAMREPTKEMIDAIRKYKFYEGEEIKYFNNIIDAALKGE